MTTTTIYARVSTETQEKQQTIDSQLAELRQYAAKHNLAISEEFIDDGYSGAQLARPGLDALRDKSRRRRTHASRVGANAQGDITRSVTV
jgi:DNA invertase Pin-like site-specific DNA recombinase